ncbi:MAG: hypothetical protein M3Y81_00565 [Chloroflexota bacterium]|nr:hypothetical protein [Chloroflexota bacterium]
MQGRADIASALLAFTGSHRFVLDYLSEEVLARQPAQVQTFLLQTSVLERLSGSLCDAVTGARESQAMLETLDRANLFVELTRLWGVSKHESWGDGDSSKLMKR